MGTHKARRAQLGGGSLNHGCVEPRQPQAPIAPARVRRDGRVRKQAAFGTSADRPAALAGLEACFRPGRLLRPGGGAERRLRRPGLAGVVR